MIDPIDPDMAELTGLILGIHDDVGGALTVHRTGKLAGFVMSNPDEDGVSIVAAINLKREDRAALIRTLIELQEAEGLL